MNHIKTFEQFSFNEIEQLDEGWLGGPSKEQISLIEKISKKSSEEILDQDITEAQNAGIFKVFFNEVILKRSLAVSDDFVNKIKNGITKEPLQHKQWIHEFCVAANHHLKNPLTKKDVSATLSNNGILDLGVSGGKATLGGFNG